MNTPLSTPGTGPRPKVAYLAAVPSDPARSTLADLLGLMGADRGEARYASAVPVLLRRVRAGETLFREGTRAESVYFVRSGTLKIRRTAEDGYEQVLGFAARTDALGLDAMRSDHHASEALALEDCWVYALPMRDLFATIERCSALGRVVQLAMSDALARQCELADAMAPVAAEVRLARFLLHLSQRMASSGQSPRRFVLRMSRRDIASYLGVAHETVSRSFTALAGWHLIDVDNRDVTICDIDGLRSLSLRTRRQIDEAGLPGAAHAAP